MQYWRKKTCTSWCKWRTEKWSSTPSLTFSELKERLKDEVAKNKLECTLASAVKKKQQKNLNCHTSEPVFTLVPAPNSFEGARGTSRCPFPSSRLPSQHQARPPSSFIFIPLSCTFLSLLFFFPPPHLSSFTWKAGEWSDGDAGDDDDDDDDDEVQRERL